MRHFIARMLWRIGEFLCRLGVAFGELSKLQLSTTEWLKARASWRKR